MITKDEFFQPWMGNGHLQVVLPFLDHPTTRKLLNNYINQGLIKLDEEPDTESPGRGRARRYSLKNAIEFAVFWSLVQSGYKPSAVVSIVKVVAERAETLAIARANPEHIAIDEWPMLIFYEEKNMKIGPLRGVSAPAEDVGAWIANPASKQARKIAKIIQELTHTVHGNIVGIFVFQADYVIRRTLEGYRNLTNER